MILLVTLALPLSKFVVTLQTSLLNRCSLELTISRLEFIVILTLICQSEAVFFNILFENF